MPSFGTLGPPFPAKNCIVRGVGGSLYLCYLGTCKISEPYNNPFKDFRYRVNMSAVIWQEECGYMEGGVLVYGRRSTVIWPRSAVIFQENATQIVVYLSLLRE
jgi:hypothetical protein